MSTDGSLLVCQSVPMSGILQRSCRSEEGVVAIDANGNKLFDGDTMTQSGLKVKGAPKDLKQGTR